MIGWLIAVAAAMQLPLDRPSQTPAEAPGAAASQDPIGGTYLQGLWCGRGANTRFLFNTDIRQFIFPLGNSHVIGTYVLNGGVMTMTGPNGFTTSMTLTRIDANTLEMRRGDHPIRVVRC